MSKNNKKKLEKEEVNIDTSTLSKKELYDLNKKKKDTIKEKNNSKKKKKKKKNTGNLGIKLFTIIMLVLMIASILASSLAYFN